VEMTRWMICKTGVRSSGCAAKRQRSGIGIDNTHWRYFHPGDDVIDQVGGRLRHAPGTAGGTKATLLTGERRSRRSNMDVVDQSRDGCSTGDELLVGAVGAAQAREGRGPGYRIRD
jgi:hypothetical protein